MLSKKEKEKNDKNNMELADESLEMNVFDKLMEGKQHEIVIKNSDGSMSITSTNIFFHFKQTNEPDKFYIKNNTKTNYDEIVYPFSKRIKLKHEMEEDPEDKPVQYTADITVEIKNRDGNVVPMRALLETGTTSTILLR
jgi:hypothetical protein